MLSLLWVNKLTSGICVRDPLSFLSHRVEALSQTVFPQNQQIYAYRSY